MLVDISSKKKILGQLTFNLVAKQDYIEFMVEHNPIKFVPMTIKMHKCRTFPIVLRISLKNSLKFHSQTLK